MSRRSAEFLVCAGLLVLSVEPTLAQTPAPAPSSDSLLTTIELWVKIIGGAIAALGTLISIPYVLLGGRKTQAEIQKIDLERKNLEVPKAAMSVLAAGGANGERAAAVSATGVNLQVISDPRLVAPLLLLVDFILAWIVLTLADHLVSIFALPFVRPFVLTALAAALLLPLAKQVLQVRAVLQPPQSVEDVRRATSLARIGVYVTCILLAVALLVLGVLFLVIGKPTGVEYYLAWAVIVFGAALGLLFLVLRRKIDRILASLAGGNRPS